MRGDQLLLQQKQWTRIKAVTSVDLVNKVRLFWKVISTNHLKVITSNLAAKVVR
jgi:hypothetical protein